MAGIERFVRLGLTVAVFSGFGALALARAAGEAIPPAGVAVAASVALAFGLGHAGVRVVRIWRGPPLVELPRERVAFCDPAQAEVVRAAAQVRGALGGAGHVHRARLVLPAVAWTAAAAFAAGFIPPGADAPLWPLGVAVLAATASVVWRPRPFHYREAMDGWLVVHPADAPRLLLGAEAAGDGSLRGVAAARGSAHPD